MTRVLIVDDEPAVRAALDRALRLDRYEVELAADGREALDRLAETRLDAVILDVAMPGIDGLEVCRRLREAGDRTPVLMLTARDSVDDRVQGLDCGADDYLVKPFALKELLARLRALLRRQHPYQPGRLEMGSLVVDPTTHSVERAGQPIELTPRVFALLEYLLYHPNQVVTREMIEQHIWNYDFECESNVIDVYIRRLRRKIDDPFAFKLLTTVRGVGYRLT